MIKTITERSLHGVIQKMKAQGVSLKDTEGFGINVDSSGHTYVVFMGEESETGVIDTSAGEAGVSAWINPTIGGILANPTGVIEIGEVKTAVAYGAETLTYSAGTTWTVTLAGASGTQYIKPRTVFVEATGNGPELVDDGLGLMRVNNNDRRAVGTINYQTGAISVTYNGNSGAPSTAQTPRVKYDYSELPNSSVFPKVAALSHIVFELDSSHKVDFALYNNDPDSATSPYQAPCIFSNSGTTAFQINGAGPFMTEHFCDSRVSICLNTNIEKRKVRWMKLNSSGNVKAVYVYWNRLSS